MKARAQLLVDGACADIWYDARDHGDTDAAGSIEATQEVMTMIGAGLPKMLDLLVEAETALAGHPDAGKGNSKVHFALHKVRAALAAD